MALGTAHYYAHLLEELKPDFRPHRHSLLGPESQDCQSDWLTLPQNEQAVKG
jgi:hypothetical protein